MSSQRTSSPTADPSLDPSFSPTTDAQSSTDTSDPSSTSSPRHTPSSVPVIAGSLVGCIVLVAVILTCFLLKRRRKRLRARFAAAVFNSSNNSYPLGTLGDPLADKRETSSGYNVNPPPRLPDTSSTSSTLPSSLPSSPIHDRPNHHQPHHSHQKRHIPTHNHIHQRQQQNQHAAQSSTSSSSAQSQTPLLPPNPSSNSAIPHGHNDLDGGNGIIFVDADAGMGGPSAGVPKIVVTGDRAGGKENAGQAAIGRRSSNTGTGGRAEHERVRDVTGRRGPDSDGQPRTSRSRGSISGSEYSYPGYVENPGAKTGDTGRAGHTERAPDQGQPSLRPGSAAGSTSGSSIPSHSQHSFPPSTISTVSSSYHPQSQNKPPNNDVLITQTYPPQPSQKQKQQQQPQQQQRQKFAPVPTYSPIASADGASHIGSRPHLQLVAQPGTRIEEEAPPAYENVWTRRHQQLDAPIQNPNAR